MLRLTGGAAAFGQARAGARSRRAPAPPSSWVCRSTHCGRPAESAAAGRCDQPAAPAHRRHGRSCARGRDRRAAARGARSPWWSARHRSSRRARNPRRPRGRGDYRASDGTVLRVECEYHAEASTPRPPRHLAVSAPAAPIKPSASTPNAALAVRQMTDVHREHPEGGGRHRAECAAFRAENFSICVVVPILGQGMATEGVGFVAIRTNNPLVSG
jgi:hypothetical protein